MKKLFFILSIFGVFNSFAQSVAPQVIGAASGSANIAGNTFQYSIGEMVLVNTANTPSVILTQGFLQPSEPVGSSIDTYGTGINISVYPNPTNDWLNISFDLAISGTVKLVLYDASGRIVMQETHIDSGSDNKLTINMADLASGAYMLHVFMNNNQDAPAFFRVQKLN